MEKKIWLFFFLLLLSKPPLKASSNQEESLLAVTVDCYCDFLNSTSAADLHDLYNSKMALAKEAIVRTGTPGNYFYFVEPENKNKLVHEVSYENQMRFCNWIENGRAPNSTETGAYDFSSLKKRAPGSCAIVDENEGKTFEDPALKTSTTKFSITGPASLLGSESALSNPKLCAGEAVILPFFEELESYFLGMLLIGSTMEAARGMGEDRALGEHVTPEFERQRENSEKVSQKIPAITPADHTMNDDAFVNGERPRLTLAEQLQEVEQEHQLAQEQYQIASGRFEHAHQKWEEIKTEWDKYALIKVQYNDKKKQVDQLSAEVATIVRDLNTSISHQEQNRLDPGVFTFLPQFGSHVYLKDGSLNGYWDRTVAEQSKAWEKSYSKYTKENARLLELTNKYETCYNGSYPNKRKQISGSAPQDFAESKLRLDQASETLAVATQKLETFQAAQTQVTAIMAELQKAVEPLTSKLQEGDWSSFVNNILTALKTPQENLFSQEAILEVINNEIATLSATIDAREKATYLYKAKLGTETVPAAQIISTTPELPSANVYPHQEVTDNTRTARLEEALPSIGTYFPFETRTNSSSFASHSSSDREEEDDKTVSSSISGTHIPEASSHSRSTATTRESIGSDKLPQRKIATQSNAKVIAEAKAQKEAIAGAIDKILANVYATSEAKAKEKADLEAKTIAKAKERAAANAKENALVKKFNSTIPPAFFEWITLVRSNDQIFAQVQQFLRPILAQSEGILKPINSGWNYVQECQDAWKKGRADAERRHELLRQERRAGGLRVKQRNNLLAAQWNAQNPSESIKIKNDRLLNAPPLTKEEEQFLKKHSLKEN